MTGCTPRFIFFTIVIREMVANLDVTSLDRLRTSQVAERLRCMSPTSVLFGIEYLKNIPV